MLIVDTGPLLAAADRSDRHHRSCLGLLEGDDGPLVTTAMVIAETAYLIDRQLGAHAEAALFASIIEASLAVEELRQGDWLCIHQLVETYADLRLGAPTPRWWGPAKIRRKGAVAKGKRLEHPERPAAGDLEDRRRGTSSRAQE